MKKNFIKSPLNYVGGKFKLLNELLPLFPEEKKVNTFVDLFGGGLNVGVNAACSKVIYNDSESHVTDLLKHLHKTDVNEAVAAIDTLRAL